MALASLPYPSRWGGLDSPLGLLLFRYSRFVLLLFRVLVFGSSLRNLLAEGGVLAT
jgi:hypothetical protein